MRRYYVIHPNGREKLGERITDEEAAELFRNHWSASADWSVPNRRQLVREEKLVLISEQR